MLSLVLLQMWAPKTGIMFSEWVLYVTWQHFDTRGRPLVSRTYMDYPWSPRWDAPQMAQRIMDFVADECIAFKKQCNDLLHHQR
jgi:hypothetical protein